MSPDSPSLGEDSRPFALASLEDPIPYSRASVGGDRARERAWLLDEQTKDWASRRKHAEIAKVQSSVVKAEDVMTTPLMNAFNVGEEPGDTRALYEGGDDFGVKCLLARRLVEAGVSFVELAYGRWDTHENNWEVLKGQLPVLDAGLSGLVADLASKDLLKSTLVFVTGDFGRTPDINRTNGRDHWTGGYSVVLAGGGIQGGRIVGNTGPDGRNVTKRDVPIGDLFATIHRACGIDPGKKYNVEGRRVKYSGEFGGKPVQELF
jgi:hypothetical protein